MASMTDTMSVYPFGVTDVKSVYVKNASKLVYIKPDAEIAELYHTQILKPASLLDFEFKQAVVKCCLRLYGNFKAWLKKQLANNDFIHGYNQEFLLDTYNFIMNGERKVMIPTWMSLVEEFPDMTRDPAFMQNHIKKIEDELGSNEDFICRWASHKDGLLDMLCTTYMLFGKGGPLVKEIV